MTAVAAAVEWARLAAYINFNCGKCSKPVDKWERVIEPNGRTSGVLFSCHGKEDILEISEAMSRAPQRLRNWTPFRPLNPFLAGAGTASLFSSFMGPIGRIDGPVGPSGRTGLSGSTGPSFDPLRMFPPSGRLPLCARCLNPVQMDLYEESRERAVVVQFACHGEREEVRFSYEEFMELSRNGTLARYRPFARRTPSRPRQSRSVLDDFIAFISAQGKPDKPAPTPVTPEPKKEPIASYILPESKPRKIKFTD